MKLIIVTDYYLENKHKPMCGTCKYRGNVSIAYDVGGGIPIMLDGELKNVRVTGVHCDHPDATDVTVEYDSMCDRFYPINDLFKRIFLTKRLI